MDIDKIRKLLFYEFPELYFFIGGLVGRILPGYPDNIRDDGCDLKQGFYNFHKYVDFNICKKDLVSFSIYSNKNEYLFSITKEKAALFMYPLGRDKLVPPDTLHMIYDGKFSEETLSACAQCILANELWELNENY